MSSDLTVDQHVVAVSPSAKRVDETAECNDEAAIEAIADWLEQYDSPDLCARTYYLEHAAQQLAHIKARGFKLVERAG